MSIDSKPLMVEFVGTPGAGKTTLMKAAGEILREQGFHAYSVLSAARPLAERTFLGRLVNRLIPSRFRRQFLWQVFSLTSLAYRSRFSRRHEGLIRYVSDSQKRRPAAAAIRERRTLHWFHHLTGRYEFFKTYMQPGEVLIFDDGFVHRAVHLHASMVETPDPVMVRAYVDLIPQPDIVIVPCAPLEVCEERIVQRGIWEHYRNRTRADLRRYLESSNQALNSAIGHIKNKGWLVIEVDNSHDDLARTHEELRIKLMNILTTDQKSPHSADRSAATSWKTQVPWVPHLPRPSRLSEFVKSRVRSLDIEMETVQTVVDRLGLKLLESPSNLPLSRRTRNLMLHTSAGRKVIKRYRARLEVPTIEYSHSILERLTELDFPGPRLTTAPTGESFVSLDSGNYALFDFVDGTNYSLSFVPPAYRHKLMSVAGQTLGCLHSALAGFMPDGWHHLGFVSYTGDWRRNMTWHAAKVDEMKEKSQSLDEDDKRHALWLVQNCKYILDELSRVDETLRLAEPTRVIIHGDYGLHNIVFHRDVVTPIDFESSRLEWRLSDLVSALSRLRYRDGTYNFESIRNFIQGYQSAYPIGAEEWRLLPLVWRFHKLRASLIYWNSYFETGGPARKLISARDAVGQADWAMNNPEMLLRLNSVPSI